MKLIRWFGRAIFGISIMGGAQYGPHDNIVILLGAMVCAGAFIWTWSEAE